MAKVVNSAAQRKLAFCSWLFRAGMLSTACTFFITSVFYTNHRYNSFHDVWEKGTFQQSNPVEESKWEENLHSDHIVYNTGCKIITRDPFDKSVKKFLKKPNPKKCKPNFSIIRNQSLKINDSILEDWNITKASCCYRSIHRITQQQNTYNRNADNGFKYSSICTPIPLDDRGIFVNTSHLRVECRSSGNSKPYMDFHGTVVPPKLVSETSRQKAEYWEARESMGLANPPSVLIIGIDSISRLHMIRSLPQTRQFLQKNDFIELKGYTKVGLNTFPNIMAGFGGMTLYNYTSCWPKASKKLDDCPFIWKEFNKLNYISAFLEDLPKIAIFNFNKVGFVRSPADYYVRPLTIALGKTPCVGGLSLTNFLIKYIKEFVQNMGSTYPYFLFSWLTAIGHDDLNGLKAADNKFLDLMSMVTNNTVANPDNTIIIFMSDHGYRFGGFRETFQGFYEESMPFFFFRLPTPLKHRYPEWYKNLKRNSRQLTSPLDLHSTFQDILQIANFSIANNESLSTFTASISEDKQHSSSSVNTLFHFLGIQQKEREPTSHPPQYKTRYSFFEYIPNNRTCQSASIPQRFCMCGVTPTVTNIGNLTSQLGNSVVAQVNDMLESTIKSRDCTALNFSRYLYAREISHGDVWNNVYQLINYTDYLLALEVKPSKAHFESKVRIYENGTTDIIGDISRINSYKGQSDCISDFRLKPYCMCENTTKKKQKQKKPGSRKKKGKPVVKTSTMKTQLPTKSDVFNNTFNQVKKI